MHNLHLGGFGVEDDLIVHAGRVCPQLTHLSLAQSSDNGLGDIVAREANAGALLGRLRGLELAWPESLAFLSRGAGLTSLAFGVNHSALADLPLLPSLLHLDLSCYSKARALAEQAGERLPQLTSLKFEGSSADLPPWCALWRAR